MSITRSTSFKSSPGPNQVLDGCQENRDMKPKSKHPYIRLLVLELDITLINGLALRFRSPKREVSRFLNTNTTYTARLLTTHIVGHHDGEEGLVGRVDGDVERGGLEEDEQGVEKDVGDGEEEVRDHAQRVALPPVPGLGRGPEERVQGVLAEGREETVAHL